MAEFFRKVYVDAPHGRMESIGEDRIYLMLPDEMSYIEIVADGKDCIRVRTHAMFSSRTLVEPNSSNVIFVRLEKDAD